MASLSSDLKEQTSGNKRYAPESSPEVVGTVSNDMLGINMKGKGKKKEAKRRRKLKQTTMESIVEKSTRKDIKDEEDLAEETVDDSMSSSDEELTCDQPVTMANLKKLFESCGLNTLKQDMEELKELKRDLSEIKKALNFTEHQCNEAMERAEKC